MHRIKLSLVVSALFFGLLAQADELTTLSDRDPFSPFLGNGALPGVASTLDDEDMPPLLKYPVNEYRVVGIISSKKGGVALVQTPVGATYYLREGDKLGADGFSVSGLDRLTVNLKNESDEQFKIQAESMGRTGQ